MLTVKIALKVLLAVLRDALSNERSVRDIIIHRDNPSLMTELRTMKAEEALLQKGLAIYEGVGQK